MAPSSMSEFMKKQDQLRVRRPSSDWYSPYFTPTTILIAAIVLILSVEAGKYAGNQLIERDKGLYLPAATLTVTVPMAHHTPMKAARHAPLSKTKTVPASPSAP